MTVCYICLPGWNVTNAGGICTDCSSFVCRTPSSRPDGWVHGYRCACGGGHLVCENDAISHSQGHGSAATLPSPCFPDLTFDVAPLAGIAASELLSTIIPAEPGRYEAIGRLLRVVAPGGVALYHATAIKGSVLKPAIGTSRIEQREPKEDFFTEGRVMKIVALAARMIAEALPLAKVAEDSGRRVLKTLFGNEQPDVDVRSACDELIGKWVPIGVAIPDPLIIPTEPAALARWLLDDEREKFALQVSSSVSESAVQNAYSR
jgi:hypothetical protein